MDKLMEGVRIVAYYHICPMCGANLDPGEKCDCENERHKLNEIYSKNLKVMPTGQIALNLSK